MNGTAIATPSMQSYVSRRVWALERDVIAAFDQLLAVRPTTTLAAGALTLHAGHVPLPPGVLRRASSEVVFGRRAFATELELARWSRHAVELLLRPCWTKRARRAPAIIDPFWEIAHDAMDQLAFDLTVSAWSRSHADMRRAGECYH